jgi:GDP-L-fucose synthase
MMNLIDRRITVTGGAGFLGSVLVNHLRALGCKNIFVPRRHEYDLTQPGDIEHFFAKARPEVLFHLAAAVGGIGANRENPGRFFYENAVMGIHLIVHARRYRLGRKTSGMAIPRKQTPHMGLRRRPCWCNARPTGSSMG